MSHVSGIWYPLTDIASGVADKTYKTLYAERNQTDTPCAS
jgi:hypothetical protein